MFKELKDFLQAVPSDAKGFDIVVEEMIDAPFVSVVLDQENYTYSILKSNGEEVSTVDIILNSMYADISEFVKTVFAKLNEKDYRYAKFGMFYFPSETPRSTTYTKYVGKFMLSYVHGGITEADIFASSDKWLTVTPYIITYQYTQKVYVDILNYVNGDEDALFTASLLTGAYKRIDKNRTHIQDMEGIVVKTPYGNFKLTLHKTKEVTDISERKMCRDLIMKDFIRWFYNEDVRPINDTYQNIVCNLFLKYVNTTDISTRYSFEADLLTPPIVGYVGDITYELLDDNNVIEICKHNSILKGIFKILLNALRKPLKKHSGDILTQKDVDDFNHIIETIKTEEI